MQYFFKLSNIFFKMYIFSCLVAVQLTYFSVAVRIYKIHIFDKAFFLLAIRVELSPINMDDT